MKLRSLVWFRGKDLRVSDHVPLQMGVQGGEVIPVFVLDDYFFLPERAQRIAHRMQFLLESLGELSTTLRALGTRLVTVRGRSDEVIPRLAEQWKVDRVIAQRWTEPFGRVRDERVASRMRVPLVLTDGETMASPASVRTKTGTPFAVYTPFARAWEKVVSFAEPLAAPKAIAPFGRDVVADEVTIPTLDALGIEHNVALPRGGESMGQARLKTFATSAEALRYASDRDRMDLNGTSRLSTDLKFGTVTARQVYHAVQTQLGSRSVEAAKKYSAELVWREFAHAVLWDRPSVLREAFQAEYKEFPWSTNGEHLEAWKQGRTGIPVVDAAARQLKREGFVHNRARMIAASFLTRQLRVNWREGEAHYLQWLSDGDWAQNNLGWQWSAGTGCDAQPYFRVFNPVSQGERFDPQGEYVKRWVPELAKLDVSVVHKPWDASALELRAAGVQLGREYPRPIVMLDEAREEYLRVVRAHLKRVRGE